MSGLVERIAELKKRITPGPWHVDQEYAIYVWGPKHAMVADTPLDDEDGYLLRMRGVGRGATEEEQDANARLCALAPEMADALEKKDRLLNLYSRFTKGLLEHDVYLEDVMNDIKAMEAEQ